MTPPQPRNQLDGIGYRADLEETALQRLGELDVPGCRKALGDLAARLDVSEADGGATLVIQLLMDVLQRVNQRIHAPESDREEYLAWRVSTFERFADCRTAEEARRRFLPALNSLLVVLQPDRSRHRVVSRAMAFIETHHGNRLSLSLVARSLAVSPSYLSRAFRRDTGATLPSYVQRVRIERAVPLVAEDRHSLSEIAYRVGFQTYRDFYRNFVRWQRVSPRQLRARLARGEAGTVGLS